MDVLANITQFMSNEKAFADVKYGSYNCKCPDEDKKKKMDVERKGISSQANTIQTTRIWIYIEGYLILIPVPNMDHTILLVNARAISSNKRRVEQEKEEHTREDDAVAPIRETITRIFPDKEATQVTSPQKNNIGDKELSLQDSMLLINKRT
eukprot:15340047-Ditylum_brightwellii.AAC.3